MLFSAKVPTFRIFREFHKNRSAHGWIFLRILKSIQKYFFLPFPPKNYPFSGLIPSKYRIMPGKSPKRPESSD
jgi:hypothetical protein